VSRDLFFLWEMCMFIAQLIFSKTGFLPDCSTPQKLYFVRLGRIRRGE